MEVYKDSFVSEDEFYFGKSYPILKFHSID